MEGKADLIKILDTEISFYHDHEKFYRNSLVGLLTLGLGSFVSFLAITSGNQITIPNENLSRLIPPYSAILLISYGLFLIYQWYSAHYLPDLLEGVDQPSRGNNKNKTKMSGDSFNIVFNLSIIIGFITSVITAYRLFSLNSLPVIIVLAIWVGYIFMAVYTTFQNVDSKRGNLSNILKITSKGVVYYWFVAAILLTGFIFLLCMPLVNGLNDFIISFYIVELQVVFVQGLAFYKMLMYNFALKLKLLDLRFKIIHNEVDENDFLERHSSILMRGDMKNDDT